MQPSKRAREEQRNQELRSRRVRLIFCYFFSFLFFSSLRRTFSVKPQNNARLDKRISLFRKQYIVHSTPPQSRYLLALLSSVLCTEKSQENRATVVIQWRAPLPRGPFWPILVRNPIVPTVENVNV